MKTLRIFETEHEALEFHVDNGASGDLFQTLRGVVQHCAIEAQDDEVWCVELESKRIDDPMYQFPDTRLPDDE